jgi:hypothetical protein
MTSKCDNVKLVNSHKDSTLRSWTRPVGETGDLADVIVTVLSLASADHNVSRVRLSDFYQVFSQLQNEFGDRIPDFYVSHIAGYPYSKALSEAVENALRLGVQVANPRFQYLEVTKQATERILRNIRGRAGEDFIDGLRPVAARLADNLKDTVRQPCES